MRMFVCEFITGGGMQDADLPPALAREGDLMLSSLLSDLKAAGYNDIVCTRDPRLEKINGDIEEIRPEKNAWQTWQRCMKSSDAIWLIAPESSGILYELTRMAEDSHVLLLGSSSEAVKLTGSKAKTIERLLACDIPAIPVIRDVEKLESATGKWVVKPDDGVGGEGCYLFNDITALRQHIDNLGSRNFIVQEFVPGIPASMSVMCLQGKSSVMACNEQLFAFDEGKGHLDGVVVNGMRKYFREFETIATAIAGAIDGLAGYVGVDLILSEAGPRVVEINPRLTTSYAGLAHSSGQNPAEMIMNLMQNRRFPDLHDVNYKPVTIRF